MIVYDFDGTIYNGDSSIDFFKYALKKHKKIVILFPKIIFYYVLYKFHIKSKERFKEAFFSFLNFVNNSDKLVDDFWQTNRKKINEFYNQKNHKRDVIISASPYFLIEPIAKAYKINKLIATNMDIKTGKIIGKNCYGQEKVLLYNKYFKDEIEEFYTDSLSDLPLILKSKKSFIVKKGELTPYKRVNDERK